MSYKTVFPLPPLLKLPAELRVRIYDYVITEHWTSHQRHTRGPKVQTTMGMWSALHVLDVGRSDVNIQKMQFCGLEPAVTRACKLIREESSKEYKQFLKREARIWLTELLEQHKDIMNFECPCSRLSSREESLARSNIKHVNREVCTRSSREESARFELKRLRCAEAYLEDLRQLSEFFGLQVRRQTGVEGDADKEPVRLKRALCAWLHARHKEKD